MRIVSLRETVERELPDLLSGIVSAIEPVGIGEEADSFVVTLGDTRLFLKILKDAGVRHVLEGEVRMGRLAAEGGIRTPAPRAFDRAGTSIGLIGGRPVAAWTWVQGEVREDGWSVGEAFDAGVELGRIHTLFREVSGVPSVDQGTSWAAVKSLDEAARMIGLRDSIRDDLASDMNGYARFALEERIRVLERASRWDNLWSELPTQLIHGDYSTMNVLVSEGQVASIVDFSPPTAHLRAYEVGRAAFNTHSIASRSDWIDSAVMFLEGYWGHVRGVSVDEMLLSARAALVQLARSAYGLQVDSPKGRWSSSLDRFWRMRTAALQSLDRNLPKIESVVLERFG